MLVYSVFSFRAMNCGGAYIAHFIRIKWLYDNFLPAHLLPELGLLLNSMRPVPSFRLTVGVERLKHYTF